MPLKVQPDRTAYRICPLCEATCGLELAVAGDEVVRVRGDRDDVFSAGYLCPKGPALVQLHTDPDRLRAPMVRTGDGFVEVSWDEAFAEAARRLALAGGPAERAVYLGNPNVHNIDGSLFVRTLVHALAARSVFTASTVDQRPKEVAVALMFGTPLSVPVPDLDRTQHLLILGANPLESNGSLATAADWPGRLAAVRARGGRVVVVDPVRTRTAEVADEHVAIRPGGDPFLLMAMVQVLFADGLVAPGRLAAHLSGVDDVAAAARPFTPEAVEPLTGVPAADTRRLAHGLAAAPSAAVYARLGTTTAPFGTLTSWLVDVLNALTGNLDRPGGAMFPKAPAGAANTRGRPGGGRAPKFGRWHSRVRGLPEILGELPVVCLAEEIASPGDGRVRALVTVAGNPVLSTPDGARLEEALAGLDCMISVDPYLNETTRHAHVILPPPSPLRRGHYDLFFSQLAIRNVARYSPPVLAPEEGQPEEWEILARLALIARGDGPGASPDVIVTEMVGALLAAAVADDTSPVAGRDPAELAEAAAGPGDLGGARRGSEAVLDVMLRTGPYGDGLGARPGGLSLDRLLASPHGIDLGPLEERIPEVLRTPTGRVELAPAPLLADVPRLEAALAAGPGDGGMVLVGRRHLRSNNSWMHNLPVLVKGKPRCTLLVHPDDAARLGLTDGQEAEVAAAEVAAAGAGPGPGPEGWLRVAVEVTGALRRGVVSLPHGWGHDRPGTRLSVAATVPGVNVNLLANRALFDPLSGTAVLNGLPVEVRPAS